MSDSAHYLVGAKTVDITPSLDKTVFLAGFGQNRRATGVLHPLAASILYVKDAGGSAVCLVSVDLIGLFKTYVDSIRSLVKDIIDPARVFVCSTHTHSGPDTMGLWGKSLVGFPLKSGVDAGYMDWLVEQVAEGIRSAVAAAEPASLASVTFDTPDHWVRNDRKGGGSYRRAVALAARIGDRIPALLVNFAAHPETLWDKNHLISPDYPGPFRARLKELGVETPIFFTGPLGAMLTPNVNPKGHFEERRQYVENLGKELAELSIQQVEKAEPLAGPILATHKDFVVANLNWRFNFAKKLGVFEREIPNGFISTEMNQLSLGQLTIATVPGEASPEVGEMLHEAMTGRDRMIFCLGCDELGYIIPSTFWNNPEYKYETTMSLGAHMAHLVVANVFEQRLGG